MKKYCQIYVLKLLRHKDKFNIFFNKKLEFITHRPDLALTPFNDYKVGLGLWNYPIAEVLLEVGLFLIWVYFYSTIVRPKRKIAFWLLIGFLLIIHIMNLIGPPSPNIKVEAWSANLIWIIMFWAWRMERGNIKALSTNTNNS